MGEYVNRFRNQEGISIVQVLIAAAMMGGLSLVMMKMSQNQSKLQKTATNNSTLNEFDARMARFLAKSDVCNKNLQGLSLSVNPGDADPSKRVVLNSFYNTDFDGNERILFKVASDDPQGKYQPSPNLGISEIYVTRTEAETLELVFNIDKKESAGKRSSFGASSINKKFTILGIFDGSDVVKSCYSDFEGSAAAACSALGGTLQPNGECKNGKLCDMEKTALKNSYDGGTTTMCEPQEDIEGMGLYKYMHTSFACEAELGTVEKIAGEKYCVVSGGCPTNWIQQYTITKAVTSTGRKKNCARPKCTTGSHSTWGAGIESCTHAEIRKKKHIADDCDNYGTVTAYATVIKSACY